MENHTAMLEGEKEGKGISVYVIHLDTHQDL